MCVPVARDMTRSLACLLAVAMPAPVAFLREAGLVNPSGTSGAEREGDAKLVWLADLARGLQKPIAEPEGERLPLAVETHGLDLDCARRWRYGPLALVEEVEAEARRRVRLEDADLDEASLDRDEWSAMGPVPLRVASLDAFSIDHWMLT